MDEISDDDLILMYRSGDAEAFEVLFDRHYRSVFNFAFYMVRDAGRAEDILQETFLAAARTAKRCEPRGHFRAWLMRIVRNRSLNSIESERLRRGVLTGCELETGGCASCEPSPVQNLEADEAAAIVRERILDLPERQREAIVLYAFEAMGYQEIAETLDLPVNTVKTLIHRARAELARALGKNEER